jgi:hypothetical protein
MDRGQCDSASVVQGLREDKNRLRFIRRRATMTNFELFFSRLNIAAVSALFTQ